MKTSDTGIEHIKRFEGCRLIAYPDPGSMDGLPVTIGYGATRKLDGSRWKLGERISEGEAEALLRRDLGDCEATINSLVNVPLAQSQFDALSSFIFNVGPTAFGSSTLLRVLNNQDYAAAANEFSRWINAGGRPLEGLIRRRKAEAEMFSLTGLSVLEPILLEPVGLPPIDKAKRQAPAYEPENWFTRLTATIIALLRRK